jgi:hypothetical protein
MTHQGDEIVEVEWLLQDFEFGRLCRIRVGRDDQRRRRVEEAFG